MIIKRDYYFEDTTEERRARDIYGFITERNLDFKELHFEIIDDCFNKNVRFTYRPKQDFNVRFLEICLATFGIRKTFLKNGKKYLVLRTIN